MIYKKVIIVFIIFSLSLYSYSANIVLTDSIINPTSNYDKGLKEVNQCTPWHHMKCVAITGTEVYEDARDGKKGRHWWRKSYIGRACTAKHGKVIGNIFEGVFVVPHYSGIFIGSSIGWLVYSVRGPRNPEKVANRKANRARRKAARKNK